MATSDAPLNVPNVTLAVARGGGNSLPDAGVYSSILEALYLQLHPDYESWGAGPRSGVTTWYYVSATATGGGDGSNASPWTLAEGIAAPLQPGQGLRLKSGTYDRSGGPIKPTWSGTAGSPIYIEADDINNPPIIDFGRTTVDTAVGPVEVSGGGIQFPQNSYVGVYGLELIGSAFGYSEEFGSDHITFEKCHLHGATGEQKNNIAIFRFDNVSKSVMRNNLITDISHVDTVNSSTYYLNPRGGSAYLSYRTGNNLFEHNEVRNVGKGYYVKQPDTNLNNGHIVRRNTFLQMGEASMEISGFQADFLRFENQIFAENIAETGVYDTNNDMQLQPQGLWVINNTFFGSGPSIDGFAEAHYLNNIILKETAPGESGLTYIFREGGPTSVSEIVELDYNCYRHEVRVFDDLTNINFIGLSAWQAADNANTVLNLSPSGPDTNSFIADPLFVDSVNGDYRLQSGSPCVGAGQGGDNIGAYATQDSVIGRIA